MKTSTALTPPLWVVVALAAASALAGGACPRAQTEEPSGQPRTLRVGTWNIENLGFRREPRTESDYAAIAKFITGMGTAVLAVQEIAGPAPMQRLCRHLGPDYDFVLGSTGWFSDRTGRISVGFLFDRRRVEMLAAEELLELPRQAGELPIFHRVPVTAVFRSRASGLDFRLVTVHLKASRGTRNEQKRCAEVAALAGVLRELAARPGEDGDLAVLGDFNHTYQAPAHQEFQKHELVRYLTPAQLHATIVHFDDPIDHVAIAPGLAEELVANSLKVHADLADADRDHWRKVYSDHLPVTIDLDDTRDRDPKATFRPVVAAHRLARGGFAAAEIVAATTSPAPGAGATPAPASSGAAPVAPFAPGALVRVGIAERPYVVGKLLAMPDLWVYLELTNGTRIAYPAQRVTSIVYKPETTPPSPTKRRAPGR